MIIEPADRLDLDVGDRVRLAENRLPPEAVIGGVRSAFANARAG